MALFPRGLFCMAFTVLCLSNAGPAHSARDAIYKGYVADKLFKRPCFSSVEIEKAIAASRLLLLTWTADKKRASIYLDVKNRTFLVLLPIERNLMCALATIDQLAIDEEAYLKLQEFIVYEPLEGR